MSHGGLPLDGIVAGHRARARRLIRLSPRQREVAELVAGGLSDPEIAFQGRPADRPGLAALLVVRRPAGRLAVGKGTRGAGVA
ncbi:hypothetical protein [Streptomyces sp. 3213.3]|uniref:hypothetical protein n=1 Tax=Streptomyces sp. 3213.3 TaxID=1855348 RepID=UPI000B8220B8|nr:hypothetical protein [Streptomyces sp. 3213.3]